MRSRVLARAAQELTDLRVVDKLAFELLRDIYDQGTDDEVGLDEIPFFAAEDEFRPMR